MEYRKLGTSDVKATAITFGAWAIGGWMWGGQDADDAVAAIRTALDAGVTSIDTAPIYGFGASEELVARALEGVRREDVQIFTKYALRWDTEEGSDRWESRDEEGKTITVVKNAAREGVIYECEQSLRRLKTDYIDLYQCHWRDTGTPVEETMEAIDRLLQQGKVLAAGVSNFGVEEIKAAAACVPLASDQPPYSMVNRGIEKDVLPFCVANDIAIIAYSPMQRGLLTGKVTEDYEFNEGDHRAGSPFFKADNRRRVNDFLAKIRPIADGHGATLAQLVINWTIHREGITVALVGARNAKQAAENAAAADFTLSDDETARINALLDELELVDV